MIISQREARRLRKRVEELEQRDRARRKRWSSDYPGGVNFCTLTLAPESAARVQTAQVLDHAIVAKIDGTSLRLYALRQTED